MREEILYRRVGRLRGQEVRAHLARGDGRTVRNRATRDEKASRLGARLDPTVGGEGVGARRSWLSEGRAHRFRRPMASALSAYELQRLDTMRRNEEVLRALGLSSERPRQEAAPKRKRMRAPPPSLASCRKSLG